MSEKQPLGRVQRTLIVSCGELAKECATQFEAFLTERSGPTAATAVVLLNGTEEGWETAVTAALHRISPPDLAARLARSGWELVQPPALHLILLLTAETGSSAKFSALLTTVTNQIYHQLSLEPLVFPIWLVGDEGEMESVGTCQTPHYPLPLGSLVLGLCNQDGLRLPDETSLCAVGAELLWCLTTFPLFTFLEQHQTDVLLPNGPNFLTAGIHAWSWTPDAVLESFVQRWRREVIDQWLLDKVDNETLLEVPGWLQAQQLTPKQFATYALHERETMLPQLHEAEWQMPWPWQISALFEKSRFENYLDEEATRAYAKQAQLRLFDPLQYARECLHKHASHLLNAQPVAGIAQTVAWLQAVTEACEASLQTVFTWDNHLNEAADTLAVARGQLEATLQEKVADYPKTPQAWLRLLWRPWRWPGHFLTYWRLQKAGQQLCQLYTQQASLRRQRIEQQTAYQGMIELMQLVRRLSSQVAEIGEMLHARRQSAPAQPATESASATFPLSRLPAPDNLYEQLLPDRPGEATAAAAAVGGLGKQIRQLDDIIFDQLAEVAATRLAALYQLPPADLLLTQEVEQKATLLQDGWAAASPLWPVDVAALDETTRQHQESIAIMCGNHVLPLSDHFSELTNTIFTLSIGWNRHVWLVRLHVGLPTPVITPFWSQEVNAHE